MPDQINDELEESGSQYQVYFGEKEITKMELLQSFNTLEQAEAFIHEQINNKQPNATINKQEENGIIWFDFGDATSFYAIVNSQK